MTDSSSSLANGPAKDPSTGALASAAEGGSQVSSVLRFKALLRDLAPAASLVVTLSAAAYFYLGSEQRGHILGFAEAVPEAVAPIETARVGAVHVNIGDAVVAGQIVATLDTSSLDAEIAVAEAEEAKLEADLLAERATAEDKLDSDLEMLQRERARQREDQARASAEAKVLDSEVSRVKKMVADRQAVLDDLTQLNLRQAAASAVVTSKPQTLGLLGQQIKAAEDRKKKVKEQSSALAAKLAAQMLVAARNVDLLKKRREGYVLRASRPGRVSAIEKRAGEVVAAGNTVLTLVSAQERVVACVPENRALGLREGDVAHLHPRGQAGAPLRGTTVALGPIVTELPARCWSSPRVPMWGREVTIALDSAVDVVAGQAFEISFDHAPSGASPAPSGSASASGRLPTSPAGVAAVPLSISVPPALSARTPFEPSGLLARPGEGRYLVVSDDTGRGDHEGEPILFSMSANGTVSADPVPVTGVSALNDVEAITAGDGGEVYLLSSQSYSKKGKRKTSRTALLRARLDGAGLAVTGEIHLAEWLDAHPEKAAALGLPAGTAALDVEAMAFQRGALYLGLKAPLDARGEAMIWRVPNPALLFDSAAPAEDRADLGGPAADKRFTGSGIALWATAKVDVQLGGQVTSGGLSDMLFLPDGSLALASTPSVADGDAGAVWHVASPEAGSLSPRLVARFPGLKPEGIAPSLTAGKLMVVFDTGNLTPWYQELPWP